MSAQCTRLLERTAIPTEETVVATSEDTDKLKSELNNTNWDMATSESKLSVEPSSVSKQIVAEPQLCTEIPSLNDKNLQKLQALENKTTKHYIFFGIANVTTGTKQPVPLTQLSAWLSIF